MPESNESAIDPRRWSQWKLVDEACDAFEQAWLRGESPELLVHWNAAPKSIRKELLYCLLRIEIEYCRRKGKACDATTYVSRFPDHADTIRRAFSDDSTVGLKTTPIGGGLRETAPRQLPARLGKFELMERLGEGGMGVVYRAVEYHNDRPLRQVALKLIRPDRLANLPAARRAEWIARFQEEALLATQLEHDHIVRVYEVGTIDDQPYFSMQFIDGQSLADVLIEGPLPNAEAAALMRDVCTAIGAAHEKGIIHRDLKPRNILLDSRRRAYVADFGLARWLEEDQSQTELPLGTAPYMSPEQAAGKNIGAAADIYGLGATLYELLTARPPFRAASVVETLALVVGADPVAPRELNPAIAADLQTICLKCLEKEPGSRYESAAAIAEELARFLEDRPILARPAGAIEIGWRWCRRNPWAAALLMLSGIVAIVSPPVAAVLYQQGSELSTELGKSKKLAEENGELAKKNGDQASEMKLLAEKNGKQATEMTLLAAEKGALADANGKLADEKGKLFEEQKRLNEQLARQSRDLALRATLSDLSNGQLACSTGEPDRGVLLLARAWESCPPDEPGLLQAVQLNLSFWKERIHRKSFHLPLNRPVTSLYVDRKERYFIATTFDHSLVLRSIEDGSPLANPISLKGAPLGLHTKDGNRVLVVSHRVVKQPGLNRAGQPVTLPTPEYWLDLIDLSDPANPQFLQSFLHDLPQPPRLALSPDGKRFAVNTQVRGFRLYSLEDGSALGEPMLHPPSALMLSELFFDVSGRTIFTAASKDPFIRLWDAEKGKADGEPLPLESHATELVVSEDKWAVAIFAPYRKPAEKPGESPVNSLGGIRVFDLATRQPIGESLSGMYSELRFIGRDTFQALQKPSYALHRYSIERGSDGTTKLALDKTLAGATNEVAPPESQAGVAPLTLDQFRQQARVWRPSSTWVPGERRGREQVGQPLRHPVGIVGFGFAPEKGKIVLAVGKVGEPSDLAGYGVSCWTLAAPGIRGKIHEPIDLTRDQILRTAFNCDATRVAVSHNHQPVEVFEVPSGKPIAMDFSQLAGKPVTALAFSPTNPDALFLFAGNVVLRADLKQGRIVSEFTHAPTSSMQLARPGALPRDFLFTPSYFSGAVHPEHLFLSTGNLDGTVHFWDFATGKRHGQQLVCPVDAPIAAFTPGPVNNIVFNRKGDKILAASGRIATVWDHASRQAWPGQAMHDVELVTAIFSGDDRLVITAGKDKRVLLWNAATGAPHGQAIELSVIPRAIASSKDGAILAIADGSAIRLFATATGTPLAAPFPCDDLAEALAFSPDRRKLFAVAGGSLYDYSLPAALSGNPGEFTTQMRKSLGLSLSPDGTIRSVD